MNTSVTGHKHVTASLLATAPIPRSKLFSWVDSSTLLSNRALIRRVLFSVLQFWVLYQQSEDV